MRTILAFTVGLAIALPGHAAEDAEKIKSAIERGVNFLLSNDPTSTHEHGIGPTCLAGLALLEADVKPTNATIGAIHRIVRDDAVREVNTYQVALAIIFLDRYADPADVGLIQILGAGCWPGRRSAAAGTTARTTPSRPATKRRSAIR